MKYMRHYLAGFLRVRLAGLYPERFFNLCRAADIELWDISAGDGDYLFHMTARDFMACRPFVKKAKVRLAIQHKLGLPFFLHKNTNRKLWAAGFFTFFLLLYVLSLFVWDIEFQGNVTYTDDMLSHFLEKQNISCGILKRGIACEALEGALRNEFNGITWVSARLSGTRLYIHVKENEVPLTIPARDETPCDLVAACDGVVTSLVVRSGKAMVKKGDLVEKGQLLVSGRIPITDDGGAEVAAHYVRSDADVVARVSRAEERRFPLWRTRMQKTGRKRYGLTLHVFDRSFVWLFPNLWETRWETVTQERQLCVAKDFCLPVRYGLITSSEIAPYEEKYKEEELEAMAESFKSEVSENLIEKGVQIIENNVNIVINGSECVLQAGLVTEEPIAEAAEITAPEEDPPEPLTAEKMPG